MLDLLPRRAFFRFEFPLRYWAKPPKVDGLLNAWKPRFMLPPLVELEPDGEAIADVYACWNEGGLHLAVDVPDRMSPPRCETASWWMYDGLRLCIDTRDARDNKRATRFCHFFYFMPIGGGRDKKQPVVGLHTMSRAKEPPPGVDLSKIKVAAHVTRRGYTLEAAIPAACLHGWEPAEHPRIGFFYKVRDLVLGDQHLSGSDDLGWNVDPSTWATAVLARG